MTTEEKRKEIKDSLMKQIGIVIATKRLLDFFWNTRKLDKFSYADKEMIIEEVKRQYEENFKALKEMIDLIVEMI